jgi:hypothetical protein
MTALDLACDVPGQTKPFVREHQLPHWAML